jgi:hypothetical protein
MARLLALLAPLVFLLGLLGLADLRGCVVHALAFLAIEDSPNCLLTGSEAGDDVEQLIGVDWRARSSSRTRSRKVVPSRKACTISDWATLGSSRKRRMTSRSDSPVFWVHARRSQEFPGHTYVPWKFPTNVHTKSSEGPIRRPERGGVNGSR